MHVSGGCALFRELPAFIRADISSFPFAYTRFACYCPIDSMVVDEVFKARNAFSAWGSRVWVPCGGGEVGMGEMAAVLLMVLGAVAAFAASEVVRELERKRELLMDEAREA
ncbi:Uncharacterised protein [uncultured Collinsella sp.]|nr:Uncharacterised protein [uncultured Collinsella sp.]